MSKIGKYTREVSVVVIGVAITLSITLWISKKNEKRDMALYLNAIKIELEENITTIELMIDYLQPDIEYENYLATHDKKLLNEDTLGYYANYNCYRFYDYALKTNAFEMFKSSGVMRLMDDKELLLSIWNEYESVTSLNALYKKHSDSKWENMEKDLLFVERRTLELSKLPNNAPMYNFYNFPFSSTLLQNCTNKLKGTKEIVSKLEKNK